MLSLLLLFFRKGMIPIKIYISFVIVLLLHHNAVVIVASSSNQLRPKQQQQQQSSSILSSLNVTELDCRMRLFAATRYAEYIQPFRRRRVRRHHQEWKLRNTDNDTDTDDDDDDDIVFQQIRDALQLQQLCPEYMNNNDENYYSTSSMLLFQQQQQVDAQQQQQQQSHVVGDTTFVDRRMQTKTPTTMANESNSNDDDDDDDDDYKEEVLPNVQQEDQEQDQKYELLESSMLLMPSSGCTTTLCIYVNSTWEDDSTNAYTTTTSTTKRNASIRRLRIQQQQKEGEGRRPNQQIMYEVRNIQAALYVSRTIWKDPSTTTIVFRTGIHYVGSGRSGGSSIDDPEDDARHDHNLHEEHQQEQQLQKHEPVLQLQYNDSGLTITGESNAYLSGAIPLASTTTKKTITTPITIPIANTKKETVDHDNGSNIQQGTVKHQVVVYVTNLTDLLQNFGILPASIPKVISLFGIEQRYIRARYPNSNPEMDQWGYNSPNRFQYSIPAEDVIEWQKPIPNRTNVPKFIYIDMRTNHDNTNRPIKNDSTMEMYNVYTTGVGGVCSSVWGDEPSYWCSNSSDGGWAEVDYGAAMAGQLNLPIGITINASTAIGQRMTVLWNTTTDVEGAIIHAWHSQSWAMHMFQIKSFADKRNDTLLFEEGGGRQGGRNWCRCDQCSYAAPWCGQRQHPKNDSDTRLISGTWYIENIVSELDVPGEFYFEHKTNLLYIIPNHTTTPNNNLDHQNASSTEDIQDNVISNLRFSILDELMRITDGASNISISNLGFRDTAATYMSSWSVPSGGDWSIHRGGAIYIENANNVSISNCIFTRLDGNAVFISQRTRNITIRRNTFEWIGESAIALWGHTNDYNATERILPMYTIINDNVMRELGIYQKQSSGVFISKAMFTTIQNNIMFNIARAAINFNDMVGGGDVVTWNLLFNTCRESGDHGPINSWDRQPFLNNALDENVATFVPIRRRISYNLIFANYGANQAVDNDDGSSWYHIYRNVMYWSTGFKMDYGGHDSIFEDNLVIGYPRKSMCVGFGSFFEGHGHIVRRNTCFASNNNDATIQLETCTNNHAILHDNQYFTPSGNATCLCGYEGPPIPFDECRKLYGIEEGSTVRVTPNDPRAILDIAFETLFPNSNIIESKKI